jgi:ElaB/YqjD/DUF883 family membrane-anchored ribosome-binding protein
VSGLQSRYVDLVDRANQIIPFFENLESQLRQQGQPLRSSIKSAMGQAKQSLQDAQSALRRGDAAAAQQALGMAEQKIDFLEQSK